MTKWSFAVICYLSCFHLALAADWNIVVTLHEAVSLSNDDGGVDATDDMYWAVYLDQYGETCVNEDENIDAQTHIWPEWNCLFQVDGADPSVSLRIQLKEHDSGFNAGDDSFDIHPAVGFGDIVVTFNIPGVTGWEEPTCAMGRIAVGQGSEDDNDDYGWIIFTISASSADLPIAARGDSDRDGLPDSWEVCGLAGVDLPGMGADPYRKDLFIELDWFIDDDGYGFADHSHEPWLPALVNGWHEFNVAPVKNPLKEDGTRAQGIALHVDVGALYSGYALDYDNDGIPDVDIDVDGNGVAESVDLDLDGVADVGLIGGLGSGTPGGGNRICGDLTHEPCTAFPGQVGEGNAEFSATQAPVIRNNNFAATRTEVFRYAVFGHYFSLCDTTSGARESAPLRSGARLYTVSISLSC